MQLAQYLTKDMILVDVEVADKWSLLERMIQVIVKGPAFQQQPRFSEQAIRQAILAREKEKSTGLANGFAYPHARLPGFEGVGIAVALLKTPIDFESLDNVPARFACMVVVAEERPAVALRLMSQFAGMVSDPIAWSFLTSVKELDALHLFLQQRLSSLDAPVTARDIMRKPFANIHPDTPLKQVTRIMLQYNCDAIEIVEPDGTLVGEITCDLLFQVGIPEFFSQLKAVGFISGFDPFEKYFEGEARALARDVMSSNFGALPETATLLEIVFELAVRRYHKVYVVADGKRVGVIDRIAVLDRVLNF